MSRESAESEEDRPRYVYVTLRHVRIKCLAVNNALVLWNAIHPQLTRPNFKLERLVTFLRPLLSRRNLPRNWLDRLVLIGIDPTAEVSGWFMADLRALFGALFVRFSYDDLLRRIEAFEWNLPDVFAFFALDSQQYEDDLSHTIRPLDLTDPVLALIVHVIYQRSGKGTIDPVPEAKGGRIEQARQATQREEARQTEPVRQIERGRQLAQARQAEQAITPGQGPSMKQCHCCQHFKSSVIECKQRHILCHDCVEKHVESCIRDGNANIRCPVHDCRAEIDRLELGAAIPKDLSRAVKDMELQAQIVSPAGPDIVRCAKCDFPALASEQTSTTQCPHCHAIHFSLHVYPH
jgi:hypothetical protein